MMSILLLFLMAFPITNGLPASPGITHIYRVDSQDASSTNKDQPMTCEFIISIKDIWLIRASGNGTLHGSEVTFRYDKTFCDFSSTYYWCPAKKGEHIHFEKTYKFDYFPKGTYSVAAEMFIQDDEKILTLVVNNCTLN
ncbi:uncharacterized protein [Apostichopus japonicus]|uniref:uncharacterized protein isoform X7 n=1 Tax=Stichopus japonicus TaxID=307972 RepID=UPI003AB7B2F3